jgi:hypothetical protein
VTVQINATTIFGARHALESCSQLIAFDTSQGFFQVTNYFNVLWVKRLTKAILFRLSTT